MGQAAVDQGGDGRCIAQVTSVEGAAAERDRGIGVAPLRGIDAAGDIRPAFTRPRRGIAHGRRRIRTRRRTGQDEQGDECRREKPHRQLLVQTGLFL